MTGSAGTELQAGCCECSISVGRLREMFRNLAASQEIVWSPIAHHICRQGRMLAQAGEGDFLKRNARQTAAERDIPCWKSPARGGDRRGGKGVFWDFLLSGL